MIKADIQNPPILDLSFIFVTYGGLLIVTLTGFFWEWSGAATFGSIYLIFVAPIVMGTIAYRNYKQRQESKFHSGTFELAILYFIIAPMTLWGLKAYVNPH